MKKILILGAGSSLGEYVISNLLKKEKYEITAIELNNKKLTKKLKKFKKRINLVCGDITDIVLMKSLIKEHDIKDIHVYITHLHSDHIGSLSSLIYYCYYVLGMEIKIHYPDIDKFYFGYNSPLIQLLTLQGNIIDTHYEFLLEPHECIRSKKVTHVNEFKSYSYTINLDDDKKIYYSGDCKEIESELIEINNGSYNQVYLESCLNESAVHMCIDYLDEVISKDKAIRDRIYIMHIDSLDLIEKVKEYGFKVVELNG